MISKPMMWTYCFPLVLAAGCATNRPFQPVPLQPIAPGSAETVYDSVRASLPTRFTVLTSVVFEYRGRSMTAMGLTRVDTDANTVSVVAMSPMGAKLFELRADAAGVEAVFVAEELKERADPTGTIAGDIRAVYLDPLPARDAKGWTEESVAVFQEETTDGRVEHVLGGDPPVLVEKRLSGKRGTVWRVTYHEYVEQDGKRYPGGIVLRHCRYGYSLVIRLKKIVEPSGHDDHM
jgi:hypothetical protein